MKCLGINMTKILKDLYSEKCKTLLRKIKDLNTWIATTVSSDPKTQYF